MAYSVPLGRDAEGIYPIVPTPFDAQGAVSTGDIARLVDFYEQCGVGGLTVLGRMGEADKLSEAETRLVISEFLKRSAGRIPVVIGLSGSLATLLEHGKFVMDHGAMGAMFRPMNGLKEDDAIVSFFSRYVDDSRGAIPICLQDDPEVNQIHLSVNAWCRISKLEPVFMLKLEPNPALPKLSRIVEAQQSGAARRVSLMPSNNGAHLPQILARGGNGTMAGFAYTDALVNVFKLYQAGAIDQALDLHDALMPLMRYKREFPMVMRKEILRRRGVLGTAFVRYPGAKMEARDHAELDQMIQRLEQRLNELNYKLPYKNAA